MKWFKDKRTQASHIQRLPRDIRQLVDKGNFVIAIKELSSRENISMTEAKLRIDHYEDEKNGVTAHVNKKSEQLTDQGFSKLTSSVTQHIEEQGVSTKVIPKWFRVFQTILFVLLLSYLFSVLFG